MIFLPAVNVTVQPFFGQIDSYQIMYRLAMICKKFFLQNSGIFWGETYVIVPLENGHNNIFNHGIFSEGKSNYFLFVCLIVPMVIIEGLHFF